MEPGFPFRYFSAREKDSYIGKKMDYGFTEYSRGVVHGMHLSGMTVTWIAERMGMTLVCGAP